MAGNNPMTAARLEELARKCDVALAPDTPDIASILELADIAGLARCAAAWAKVEGMLQLWPIAELRNTGKKRVVESGNRVRSYADTLIAAVEAAPEVTDANKS